MGSSTAAYFAADVAGVARRARAEIWTAGRDRGRSAQGRSLEEGPSRGWQSSAPAASVYVSCNPTTLAPNAKQLVEEHGYMIERVRPVDMFPHTPHIESVTSLVRVKTEAASAL